MCRISNEHIDRIIQFWCRFTIFLLIFFLLNSFVSNRRQSFRSKHVHTCHSHCFYRANSNLEAMSLLLEIFSYTSHIVRSCILNMRARNIRYLNSHNIYDCLKGSYSCYKSYEASYAHIHTRATHTNVVEIVAFHLVIPFLRPIWKKRVI